MKRVFILLSLLFTLNYQSEPIKADPLIIVYPDNNPPVSFSDKDQQPQGILIDLWRLWASQNQMEIRFQPSSWAQSFEQIQTGKANIHAGLFYDENNQGSELQQSLRFSNSLLPVNYYFFFHKSLLGIETWADLTPFRVGLVANGFSQHKLEKKPPKMSWAMYPNYKALYAAAHRGDIKVFVSPLLNYQYYLHQANIENKPYRYHANNRLFTQNYRAAVHVEQADLHAKINLGIDKISQEQQIAIRRHWLAGQRLDAKNHLLIATDAQNSPFSFVNEQGEAVGLFVDFWRLWASKNNKEIEFIAADSKQCQQIVREGLADFYSGSIKQNKRWSAHSDLVYQFQRGLFYPRSFKFSGKQHDFRQQRIAILDINNESALRAQYVGAQPIYYSNPAKILEDLDKQKIQAYFGEKLAFQHYLSSQGRQHDLIYQQGKHSQIDIYALLLASQGDLLTVLNKGLDKLSDQDLLALEKRWLDKPIRGHFHQQAKQIQFSQAEKNWIAEHPVVKLSGEANWLPLSYFDNQQLYTGIAHDYLQLIEQYSGIHFEYQYYDDWQTAQVAFENKKIDLLDKISPQQGTKNMNFSEPYLKLNFVLINIHEAPYISDLRQLDNASIGILKNLALGENSQYMQQFPNLTLIPYRDPRSGLEAVSTRKIDAFIMDSLSFNYYRHELNLSDLKIAGPTEYSKDISFGIHIEEPLLQSIIDKSLAQISLAEKNHITKTWIVSSLNNYQLYQWAWKISVLVISIILFFSYWNYRLRQENIKRKVAEQKLRTSREHLRLTMEAAHVGVWDLDLSEGKVHWNHESAMQHGFPISQKQASLQSWLYDSIHAEDRQRVLEQFADYIEDRIDHYRVEYRTQNSHWLIAQGHILDRNEYGMPSRILGISQDITQRKQNETALANALNIAQAATEAKSEFLANMSHEIRTPMNAIIGMIHLALDTELDDQQRDYLQKTHQSAYLLLGVINDILDISKIEARKLEIEQIEFELYDVVKKVMDTLSVVAEQKNIKIICDHDDNIPNHLIGDPLRLGQILLNLINNAIKFTEQGQITLHSEVLKRENNAIYINFSITDTGIGIPEAQLKNLFNAFTQADKSTTRRYGGTGLGLAISQSLIQMMKGHISVRSEVGKGSCFQFSIRFQTNHKTDDYAETTQSLDAQNQAQPNQKKPRIKLLDAHILLVEDNVINQQVAEELLMSVGLRVSIAKHGLEAIQKAKEHTDIDLILMDIQMPEMDGLQATQKIRDLAGFDTLPIIAMTAHASSEDKQRSLNAGMNDHLVKPIDPPLLFSLLKYWLKKQAKSNENDRLLTKIIANKYDEYDECDKDEIQTEQTIIGIDWQAALRYTNNNGHFLIRLLHGFYQNHAQDLQRFSHAIKQCDLYEAQSIVHTLFSASAHVGANQLSKVCATLENTLKQQHILRPSFEDRYAPQLETFESSFSLVFTALLQWQAQQQNKDSEHDRVETSTDNADNPVDKAEFKKAFKKLKRQLKAGEVNAKQSLVSFIQAYPDIKRYATELDALKDDMDNYDFDDALDKWLDLEKKLNESD